MDKIKFVRIHYIYVYYSKLYIIYIIIYNNILYIYFSFICMFIYNLLVIFEII